VIFLLINFIKLRSILPLIEILYFLLVTIRLLVNKKCENTRRVIWIRTNIEMIAVMSDFQNPTIIASTKLLIFLSISLNKNKVCSFLHHSYILFPFGMRRKLILIKGHFRTHHVIRMSRTRKTHFFGRENLLEGYWKIILKWIYRKKYSIMFQYLNIASNCSTRNLPTNLYVCIMYNSYI
jgi:hypothetical protein